ncbi:MAG TPA: hypothetical protein VLJ79_20525 [Candidatus Binatia bacterium]|nr:hypothetical protein [Candidatus Binatia bacterium]
MIRKLVFLIVMLFLPLLADPLYGADADPSQRPVIEGAKKEAKLVFYTSVETEFARSLTTAFEAKYPFIKTDIFRSTHEKILSRINVERKTGTYTADVVSAGEFETGAAPQRSETFYRLYPLRRRTKDLCPERQGVSEAGPEAGRLSRPSQGFPSRVQRAETLEEYSRRYRELFVR